MSHLQIFLLVFAILALVVIWRFQGRKAYLEHAVGVRTADGRFTELIPSGAELPFVFSDCFHNAFDFQDDMMIELMQNRDGSLERIDAVTMDGLSLKPKGMVDLEIRLVVSRKKTMRMSVLSRDDRVLKTFGPYALDEYVRG